MKLQKLKTVLFDLDGTLLDTAADLAFALNKVLMLEGYPEVTLEQVRKVASDGSPGLLGLGFQIDAQDLRFPKLRESLIQNYQAHLSVHTKPFPGMEKVLQVLDDHNIPWGIVTNKPNYLALPLLADLDLADRAACIIGGDSVSNVKPFPDSLLLACEMTSSIPSECVYIGDAERDIEAARRAGMRSIAALYGYLPENALPELWNADYYIDQPRDLISWIDQHKSCGLV